MVRVLIAVCLLALTPSVASADTGVVPISLAEGSFAGLRASSPGRFQDTGSTIADVGDVNGDGVSDVAVGAAHVDAPGRTAAGVVYVVFGGTPLGRVDLRTAPGFRIVGPRQGANRPLPRFQPDGPPKGAMAGSAVAGAGDVNADGLADILVGAPFAGRRGRAFSGSVYVVFGKRSTSPVDLQRLGRGGFRIDGPRRDAAAANEVAGVGDVNGDGRADVVVSSGRVQVSTAYVVFGKASATPVDLRHLRRGFAIRGGRREFGDVGDAVSGAGDFNGDGFADVAVGAPQSRAARREGAGATFVVFGARRPGNVDVRALGRRGVEIDGEHEFANFGETLAPLGDVNGDGRGDLLVGASQVSAMDRSYAGAAYVVFGQPASGRIDLLRPGASAYRILGPATPAGGQARAGMAVAALGDVNGDGRRDMIIGAPGAGRRCSADEGGAYVVFTPAAPAPIDLGDLGAGGYLIRGGVDDANAGTAVASAGDWNRDGRADALVLRTDFDDSTDGKQAPQLDLLLGREPPPSPPAGSPPQLELVQPSLPALFSRRGIEARVTVAEAAAGENIDVVVTIPDQGQELPLAAARVPLSAPGTSPLRLRIFDVFSRAFQRRTRLPVTIFTSHCKTAGHEYSSTTAVTLTRP